MPITASFIDEWRAAFGTEEINAQIRLGIQGAETFYAVENGIEIGTRISILSKAFTNLDDYQEKGKSR